jgi:cytochrome c
VYRRGNRAPKAVLTASVTAGRHPLKVALDAGGSSDPDGDALKFTWGNGRSGVKLQMTFGKPGTYKVALTATDPSGAESTATQTIQVGNARPVVRFTSPAHGSFFDWKEKIDYKIEVRDAETAKVDPNLVSLQGEFRNRRFLTDVDGGISNPGLALMRKSTCFACHISDAPSAGPSYEMVAKKYAGDVGVREQLAQKVLTGGTGVWGQVPMLPHPQHTIEQTRLMVDWVLSLAKNTASTPRRGTGGVYTAPAQPDGRVKEGVLLLTAGYTDAGAEGALPLRGESTIVLHSRRKKAALYDVNHGMQYIEEVEGENGLVGLFENGDYIIFRDLNLSGIKKILVRAGNLTKGAARFELRQGSPTGWLLASVNVKPTGAGEFVEIPVQLKNAKSLTDVCVVAKTKGVIGLNWIEFGKSHEK